MTDLERYKLYAVNMTQEGKSRADVTAELQRRFGGKLTSGQIDFIVATWGPSR